MQIASNFLIFFSLLFLTQISSISANQDTTADGIKAADQAINAALAGQEQTIKELQRSRFKIVLEPMHWFLEFESSAQRRAFIASLKKLEPQFKFRKHQFMAFTVEPDRIVELVNLVRKSGNAKNRGSQMSPDNIPNVSEPAEVSLYLHVPNGPSEDKTFYWALDFLYKNGHRYKRKLKREKFQVVYDDDKLWVLELYPNDYKKLQEITKGFIGLVVEKESDEAQADLEKLERFYIVLYSRDPVSYVKDAV